MTSRTATTIRATQNKKLIRPILAPLPHGSHTLVTSAAATSTTNITTAWAVPLFCPTPITTPHTRFARKRSEAKSWLPAR
jgi:hypothetical protein